MLTKVALVLGLLTVLVGTGSAGRAAATTYPVKVLCRSDGGHADILAKPTSCEFTCAKCSLRQAGTYLVRLRWKRWGSSVTSASGVYRGNMNTSTPATIRLSRLVRCYNGYRNYSRARMVVGGGAALNFTLPTCL